MRAPSKTLIETAIDCLLSAFCPFFEKSQLEFLAL